MSRLAIGVDLGGTQVRAALVDGGGAIIARAEADTDAMAGPQAVLAQIEALARGLVETVDPARIVGVGVSTPGPVDTLTGVASDIPTLAGFAGFPLLAELRQRFTQPVSLENDGIAAAIGEWQFGAGQSLDHMVYVTVSTGIGGGVISDGRVVRGRKGMAGHIGHMVLVPGGAGCPCGGLGCFEAYASGTALALRGRAAAAAHPGSFEGVSGGAVGGRAIFAADRTGDPVARRLVDEEAEWLGRGFVNLLHVYSPEAIVMGGGIAQEFDRLHPGIAAYIRQFAMPAFRDVPVLRAALGTNSGLVGSAALAFLAQS
ncbi:glucokinase [Rhizobium sp. RU20A]|uniref:ROK family protein n=1 Tax=Rhizobium sp. RU20A TaxID=1907412 RepID=UPI00095549A0|nr:ROK family protein [Rhizobium sp. RU20A]SIR45497.1 glucokinase [Rhizobium sp. RU20A]